MWRLNPQGRVSVLAGFNLTMVVKLLVRAYEGGLIRHQRRGLTIVVKLKVGRRTNISLGARRFRGDL